jgi:SAM-dependent methyltransferase
MRASIATPYGHTQKSWKFVEVPVTATQTPDLAAIKQRQQQAWSAGDFAMVGSAITMVSELLCEAADLGAGQRVLDVATGSGNTALAAARRWCEVTGVDYVPALLERARERAAVERLQATFGEGDAEKIPFPDAAFDVVLSTFGSMFAPDQEQAARELLRVCRPGGKIGMANWTPDGFIGEMFRVNSRFVPPPAGLQPPPLWGTEDRLSTLFGGGISDLTATKRDFVWRYRSADHWIEFFRSYYGPTQKTFDALGPAQQHEYAAELRALVGRHNRSEDSTMVVPAAYLEVVATRK